MKDMMVRGLAADKQLFVLAATTTELVQEAATRHNTSPTATAALGRTLTAGLMMAATLKGDDLLTLQIKGGGPIGTITVTADGQGGVRGYAQNPAADLPSTPTGKLDVGGVVGHEGTVVVIRDIGLKKPYSGTAPLLSGEIAEDIAHYYAVSEQTPTVMALGVLVGSDCRVKAAGGYMIQAMPGADDALLEQVEHRVRTLPSVTQMLTQGAHTAEQLAQQVLGSTPWEMYAGAELKFFCPCSKERFGRILITVGEEELADMVKEGEAELTCHFCGEQYHYDKDELRALLQEAAGKQPD